MLHVPVLLDEVLSLFVFFQEKPGILLDATFGRGGHTAQLLAQYPLLRIVAIDRDPEAVQAASLIQAQYPDRFHMVHARFSEMDSVWSSVCSVWPFEGSPETWPLLGVLMDLGVSSPQLDDPKRGFSWREDGPLDMGMGLHEHHAAFLINHLPETQLADLFYQYGEEFDSRRIARAIVQQRVQKPFSRTHELMECVTQSARPWKRSLPRATLVFQALRIAVNQETEEVIRGLQAAERILNPEGRLVVISFHSLEDRLVKRFLAERCRIQQRGFREPALPDPSFMWGSKHPVVPSEKECQSNPRARSAHLRWAIRTLAATDSRALAYPS